MKKYVLFLVVGFLPFFLKAELLYQLAQFDEVNVGVERTDSLINPLSEYSPKWNDPKFHLCNTGKSVKYLSNEEKNVMWVLNMIRMDPQLFLNSVLMNEHFYNHQKTSTYYLSLISDIKKLKPNNSPLLPDSSAYVSARCHAIQAGKRGYIGHERGKSGCIPDYRAECCDYGSVFAIYILMDLLVDEGIESLGHRVTCLSPNYHYLGVSIQPHKSNYGTNTVMDFN